MGEFECHFGVEVIMEKVGFWDWMSALLTGRQRRVTFILISKLDDATTVEAIRDEAQNVLVMRTKRIS